jgi:hypothetical protein
LFFFGVVVFRSLVRALNVFDPDERTTLAAMLENRRLGAIGRVVGV